MPFPKPPILPTNVKKAREVFEDMVSNCMAWMKLDGYTFQILFKDEQGFKHDEDAGLTVNVEFPYKKFNIHVQPDTYARMVDPKGIRPFWINLERSIMHELTHVILWELAIKGHTRYVRKDELLEAEEAAVDHIANVMHSMLQETRKKK